MARRIVLFSDGGDGWHRGRLLRAFRAAGVEPVVASLCDVDIVVEAGSWGLGIPGLTGGPPDAALVRVVAGGGFETVTLRLDALHALSALGVPVVNPARAIERCVDKAMTSFRLHRAGLPTPPTFASESAERAGVYLRRTLERGDTAVAKPLFGSQGRGLRRLERGDALVPEEAGGVHYVQRFVAGDGEGYRDWRVFVIGGQPVAVMMRVGAGWITNVHQGAECRPVSGDTELEELGIAAAAAVGAEYAGVDIIRDAAGQPFVLEVNSMPAWRGLQSVTGRDIAAVLVEHVLGRAAAGGGDGDDTG